MARELGLPPVDDTVVGRAVEAYFAPEEAAYRLYDGAHAALEGLAARGLALGLISNATDHALVARLMAPHGLKRHFRVVISSAGHGRRKPHVEIFRAMERALDLPADGLVMVGDTLGEDTLGARQAGWRGGVLVDIDPNPGNAALASAVRPSARVTRLVELPDVVDAVWA